MSGPKNLALQAGRPGHAVDFLDLAILPLQGEVPHFSSARWVRYEVRFPRTAPPPPGTEFQKVVTRAAGTYQVTVFQAARPTPRPEDPSKLSRYVQPTAILQANAPLLVSLAHRAVRGLTDPYRKAARLAHFVDDYIVQKGYSLPLATALDVARLKKGDCTEHAVLLAALARAAGLPSRLASGLVFTPFFQGRRNVFVYHMWAEIHVLGHWVPFDGTRPEKPVGPDHLLLALDAGDALIPTAAAASLAATLGRTHIRALAWK